MKICKDLSIIERLMLFRENVKQNIEQIYSLNKDSKIVTFYNLLFLTKFDNIFPISEIERYTGISNELSIKEVTKSLKEEFIKDIIIDYKGYSIKINYYKSYDSIFINSMDFTYKNYENLILKNINKIDFEVDDLSVIMEEKYQLILNKFEKMIQKDKMLKNNINFMRELIGIEIS